GVSALSHEPVGVLSRRETWIPGEIQWSEPCASALVPGPNNGWTQRANGAAQRQLYPQRGKEWRQSIVRRALRKSNCSDTALNEPNCHRGLRSNGNLFCSS